MCLYPLVFCYLSSLRLRCGSTFLAWLQQCQTWIYTIPTVLSVSPTGWLILFVFYGRVFSGRMSVFRERRRKHTGENVYEKMQWEGRKKSVRHSYVPVNQRCGLSIPGDRRRQQWAVDRCSTICHLESPGFASGCRDVGLGWQSWLNLDTDEWSVLGIFLISPRPQLIPQKAQA